MEKLESSEIKEKVFAAIRRIGRRLLRVVWPSSQEAGIYTDEEFARGEKWA